MRTRPTTPVFAICAAALAVVTFSSSLAGATGVESVDRPATVATPVSADRTRVPPVALDGSVHDIAIVGDSLLADLEALGGAPTYVVDAVDDALRSRPATAEVRVHNFAVAGLTTRFGPPSFRRLGPYIRSTFTARSDLPDLVIVAVSSTGLNGLPDDPVAALAPEIISELHVVAEYLDGLGVRTVFVPVFGVNSEIFNVLQNINRTTYRDFKANERIDELNDYLAASDLPFLFDRFRLLDADRDGSADRRYFVGREGTGGNAYDDGIHPNEVGATVYAYNVIDALINAYEAG